MSTLTLKHSLYPNSQFSCSFFDRFGPSYLFSLRQVGLGSMNLLSLIHVCPANKSTVNSLKTTAALQPSVCLCSISTAVCIRLSPSLPVFAFSYLWSLCTHFRGFLRWISGCPGTSLSACLSLTLGRECLVPDVWIWIFVLQEISLSSRPSSYSSLSLSLLLSACPLKAFCPCLCLFLFSSLSEWPAWALPRACLFSLSSSRSPVLKRRLCSSAVWIHSSCRFKINLWFSLEVCCDITALFDAQYTYCISVHPKRGRDLTFLH